jgi:hypothetical protein
MHHCQTLPAAVAGDQCSLVVASCDKHLWPPQLRIVRATCVQAQLSILTREPQLCIHGYVMPPCVHPVGNCATSAAMCSAAGGRQHGGRPPICRPPDCGAEGGHRQQDSARVLNIPSRRLALLSCCALPDAQNHGPRLHRDCRANAGARSSVPKSTLE